MKDLPFVHNTTAEPSSLIAMNYFHDTVHLPSSHFRTWCIAVLNLHCVLKKHWMLRNYRATIQRPYSITVGFKRTRTHQVCNSAVNMSAHTFSIG